MIVFEYETLSVKSCHDIMSYMEIPGSPVEKELNEGHTSYEDVNDFLTNYILLEA